MSRSRKRKVMPSEPDRSTIGGMAHDGRGVAHAGERTVFVFGALPGEDVSFLYTQQKRDIGEAYTVEVHEASPDRVMPQCQHYGICGGCILQHLDADRQIDFKQNILAEQLRRIGKVEPMQWWAPLRGPHWGYRSKARLGVKHVPAKGRVLVGFRERLSGWLADMHACPVLDQRFGRLLDPLSELVGQMALRDHIPQIEVAAGDEHSALVFRILRDIEDADHRLLCSFGQTHGMDIYLQREGPDSLICISGEPVPLRYSLPAYDIHFEFRPVDFTQVNLALNRLMIQRVLDTLPLTAEACMLDLFCGLGNFTLPLARRVAQITGVEGGREAVERAKHNAQLNHIDNAIFHVADLTRSQLEMPWATRQYDAVLLDPSRAGALEILECVPYWRAPVILYVSCNPATLARDAAVLVHEHGYRLEKAGVMDMFPHTGHVESMALFTRVW